MFFALSEKQNTLRNDIRSFLSNQVPNTETRRLMLDPLGYDRGTWVALVDGLIPNWSSRTVLDLAVIQEEFGRSLYSGPFLSSCVMSANILSDTAPDDPARALLTSINAGRSVLAVAAGGDRGLFTKSDVAVVARGDVLNGRSNYVVDGASADALLVVAREGSELAVFVVDPTAAGVERRLLPTLDQTRRQAEITFSDVDGQRLTWAESLSADHSVDRMFRLTQVAIAAEQVGGAQQCLDIIQEYVKQREQFGRAIGSFQAIKHACANLVLKVESARSAAYYAAWVADNQPDELVEMSALAKIVASDAYLKSSEQLIQLQGGVGFTWDNPAHLYFKRAKSDEMLFGNPSAQKELLGDLILG